MIYTEQNIIEFPDTGFLRGRIPNKQFFKTTSGWLYPNAFYLKKKVCNPPLQDVVTCVGDAANIGIGQYVNFIPAADVVSMPVGWDIAPNLSNENFASSGGQFKYKPGKLFTRIQTLPDKRMFDLSSEGVIGQLTPRSKLVFNLPFSVEAFGATKKMLNNPGIVVFSNVTDQRIVVGTMLFPARITDVQVKQSETESYITITFQNGVKFPMFYDGNL